MNITDIRSGTQVIAQLHTPDKPTNEFPARFVGIYPTEQGTWIALFLFQPTGQTVWHSLIAEAVTTSGPWAISNTDMALTIRPEKLTTITELAEHIAWDGTATPELEARIIAVLGLDPEQADGDTIVAEDAAELAYNEISIVND